jgi:hypothetical protein
MTIKLRGGEEMNEPIACMVEMSNTYRILVGNPEGKTTLTLNGEIILQGSYGNKVGEVWLSAFSSGQTRATGSCEHTSINEPPGSTKYGGFLQ